MSSGHKRIFYNTRERLISTDDNRAQAFIAADRAAFHRRFFQDRYTIDTSSGYAFEPSTIASPLLADVIGGLMVVPQIGTTSVTITPGELVAYYPDATSDPDDDPSKVIFSAGVSAIGSLVIAANGGGGTRIDIIECQPIEQVEEQDNRDIFNPATGLFTPALVNKVIAGRLQFRVRSGTVGGGWPGTATGWLPLAVASVPAGSASIDTVTFWDVRPLIVDREVPPFHAGSLLQQRGRGIVYCDEWSYPGTQLNISGAVDFCFGYYKAGGTIQKGTPTAVMGTGDVPWIDALNAENQEPGFAPVAYFPWFVYVLFPFGLPRWVRYSEASLFGLGRIPGAMRGIGVVSTKQPNYTGAPSVAIALPTSTGLGGSTQLGGLLAAGVVDNLSVPRAFVSDGRMCHQTVGLPIAPTSTNINSDFYSLTSSAHYPANARKLRLQIACTFTGAANAEFSFSRLVALYRFVAADTVCTINCGKESGAFDATGTYVDQFTVEIPMIPTWPSFGAWVTRNIAVGWFPSAGATGRSSGSVLVMGWDLGP